MRKEKHIKPSEFWAGLFSLVGVNLVTAYYENAAGFYKVTISALIAFAIAIAIISNKKLKEKLDYYEEEN